MTALKDFCKYFFTGFSLGLGFLLLILARVHILKSINFALGLLGLSIVTISFIKLFLYIEEVNKK